MARRRDNRSRTPVRLAPMERLLFIMGATTYVVGLFGGISLLPMPQSTAILLLAAGGGLQLAMVLLLIF
ncbi:MAG: hypothetical protein MUF84_10270 [Anaerolineae bacterium]|nr:hypothetical protein [Anaerolineae bacterium]